MGRRWAAFGGGLASHFAADVVPHRDLDTATEAVLVALTLWGIARWQGWGSPSFWGALGGALPDLENALHGRGEAAAARKLFPTHRGLHGPECPYLAPQLLVAAACVAVLAASGSEG